MGSRPNSLYAFCFIVVLVVVLIGLMLFYPLAHEICEEIPACHRPGDGSAVGQKVCSQIPWT